MAASDDILIATESFIGKLGKEEFTARGGETRIRASHPAAKKWPEKFKPLDVHFDVEKATAAPGEKRGAAKAPEPKPAGHALTTADFEKRG